ncbi:hypothetical protein HY478_01670 [Candidatus Uhrbacteria bacterium]|nr:hypothetical protein [Candidatus Uhrbacteria bacterium]
MYNEGISTAGDALDAGVAYGIVTKTGNSYAYGDEKFGVGHEAAKQYLRAHGDRIVEIRNRVLAEASKREDAPAREEALAGVAPQE